MYTNSDEFLNRDKIILLMEQMISFIMAGTLHAWWVVDSRLKFF